MELDSSLGSDQPAGAGVRKLARALFPVHPFLIALFPVLSLLAANIQEIPVSQSYRSLLVVMVGTAALLAALLILSVLLVKPKPRKLCAILPFLIIPSARLSFRTRYMQTDEIGRVLSGLISDLPSKRLSKSPMIAILDHARERFFNWQIWGFVAIAVPLLKPLAAGLRRVPMHVGVLMHGFSGVGSTTIPLGMLHVAMDAIGYGKSFLKVSFDRALFPNVMLLAWTAVAVASKPAVNGSER